MNGEPRKVSSRQTLCVHRKIINGPTGLAFEMAVKFRHSIIPRLIVVNMDHPDQFSVGK